VTGAFETIESNAEAGIAAAETAAQVSAAETAVTSIAEARASGTALESGITDATASLNNETAVAQNLSNQATPNCFAGEMLISTETGKKRIDSLAVGDKVLSRSEIAATSPLELKEVERIFSSVAAIVNLHVGGQIIRTTSGHPFWTQGRGWVPTSGLRLGDHLLSEQGTWGRVEGVADSGQVTTVYNVRVADYHTYYVSAAEQALSFWAHNDYDAFAAEVRNQIPEITNAEIQNIYSNAFPDGVVTDAGLASLETALNERGVSADGVTAIQEAASQVPAEVPIAAPVLEQGNIGQMFHEMVDWMSANQMATQGQLVGLFEGMAEQITEAHPNWTATRDVFADGTVAFVGRDAVNVFAIRPNGEMFQSNPAVGCISFNRQTGQYEINYSVMKVIK